MNNLFSTPLYFDTPEIMTGPEFFIQFKDLLTLYHLRYSQGKPFVVSHKNSQGFIIRQFFALEETAKRKFERYASMGFPASLNDTLSERDFLKNKYEALRSVHKSDILPDWAFDRLVQNFKLDRSLKPDCQAVLHWFAPWLNVHYYVLSYNPENQLATFILVQPPLAGVYFIMEKLMPVAMIKIPTGFDSYLRLERDIAFNPVNALQLYASLESNPPKNYQP